MESGINKKIRVVWICHFTNINIQRKLKVRKEIPEFAQWISLGIEEAKKRNNIELYIVSPHRWITGIRQFSDKNIHYFFFNSGIPFYGRPWPRFFRLDVYTNYFMNKQKVKKIVNKIHPEIIHLHGLENAYYSSTVIQFLKKYPIFATIQGFISLDKLDKDNRSLSKEFKKRINVEKNLLKKIHYFGIRTEAMKLEIKKYNTTANLYWHEYFLNISKVLRNINIKEKKYDLIFFARITKSKGVEDLIIATGLLKSKFPQIKTAIIGRCNKIYLQKLKELAEENNCLENIDFLGFLPKQKDVYEVVHKSRICVLPTYNDAIPGTIIESMFRKIPVVSYKTGGIPDINKEEEIVLLSNPGDINGLVKNIEKLLFDKTLQNEYGQKAYEYARKRWNNEKAMDDIIKAYMEIINQK